MAVLKPKEQGQLSESIRVTESFYTFLIEAVQKQLSGELLFITANKLSFEVDSYVEEYSKQEVVLLISEEEPVELTVSLQDLFFYEDHVVAEVHVTLPISASRSDLEGIWRRLLSGRFPNHGLRNGDLCVFVEFHGDDLPEQKDGIFGRRGEF